MVNYKKENLLLRNQVKNQILDLLNNGEHDVGSMLPSLESMGEDFQVHPETIRKALESLEGDGLVKIIQGKGIFVSKKPIKKELKTVDGFTQKSIIDREGASSKVVRQITREAGPYYSGILGIKSYDLIYMIEKLYIENGSPQSYDYIYIPYNLIPKLYSIDLNVFSNLEIYDMFKIKPIESYQTFDISAGEIKIYKSLEVDKDEKLIRYTSTIKDIENRVIEYRESYIHGEQSEFLIYYENKEN